MLAPLYIALLHHPVLNKHGAIVTTSITNFDLHDLARTSRTYGVKKSFIVTPSLAQQGMAQYIKKYWRQGYGSEYNSDRCEAFEDLEITSDLGETRLTIQETHGSPPALIATSAKTHHQSISCQELRQVLDGSTRPALLLFGTGWGIAPSVIAEVDYVLAPVKGTTSYNHLPVRAAVAIILDRLLGG